MKYLSILPILLILNGCGGAGEEGSSNNNNDVVTLDEVEVSERFDFVDRVDLVVNVTNNNVASRTFLNICNDYDDTDPNNILINYETCQLRTSLSSGDVKQYSLTISNNTEDLLAQIWVVENNATPVNITWNAADEDFTWDITIN